MTDRPETTLTMSDQLEQVILEPGEFGRTLGLYGSLFHTHQSEENAQKLEAHDAALRARLAAMQAERDEARRDAKDFNRGWHAALENVTAYQERVAALTARVDALERFEVFVKDQATYACNGDPADFPDVNCGECFTCRARAALAGEAP